MRYSDRYCEYGPLNKVDQQQMEISSKVDAIRIDYEGELMKIDLMHPHPPTHTSLSHMHRTLTHTTPSLFQTAIDLSWLILVPPYFGPMGY